MSQTIGRMRAMGFERYGGSEVMKEVEVPRPAPGGSEVLVRVAAAAVNPADWRIRNGQFRFFMRLRPALVPGGDLSGVVEAVGAGVTRFRPGAKEVA